MTDQNTSTKEISDALCVDFERWMFEEKQGRSYISQEFVRQRLIEATGNRFDFSIQSVDYRNDGALKDRAIYDKNTKQPTGEFIPAPPVCIVIGTLSIPGLGSRSEIGVQEMEAGSGADAAYKGAVSDCLKRCALAFGVGLFQLYVETNKQYIENQRKLQRSSTRQQAANSAMVDHDQFREDCVGAFVKKDSESLKRLISVAGDDPTLWSLMVMATQEPAQIDWVAGAMEKRGVGLTDTYTAAAIERRKKLEG